MAAARVGRNCAAGHATARTSGGKAEG